MNMNDSMWLTRALINRGFVETTPDKARIHIINTCSVRNKPEQKVYSALGKIRVITKKRPDAFAVVAGCVAQQIGKKFFSRFPQVRLVVGTDGLQMAPEALVRLCEEEDLRLNLTEFSSDFPERDPEIKPLVKFEQSPTTEKTQEPSENNGENKSEDAPNLNVTSYINIMQGCDNYCAYCIVPYTRGRQKSRSTESVLNEANLHLQNGAKEIVLLGQNVNAFGQDSMGDGTSFAKLLYKIADLKGLERLRFITSHPKDFSDETIQAFKDLDVIMPQLHLPFQAGSDKILKLMRRKYTRTDYLNLVEKLKKVRPDIALSTDIIVGFPSETDEDFNDTLSLMREVEYSFAYSFCYSDRPQTRASKMQDKVAPEIASERLGVLKALQTEHGEKWLKSRVGLKTKVLIDNPARKVGNYNWQGRDTWGNIVHIKLENKDVIKNNLDIKIIEAKRHSVVAELI